MDKLAQKRSLRSKVWESANLSGKALEGLHSEFGEVMDKMRTTDESIRNVAEDVKPLIRQAKSAARKRDYLNAALAISEFHKRVRHVSFILGNFKKNVNLKHFNYLLDNFDSGNKDQLFNYNPNAELKEACQNFDSLVKEAGWFKDRFHDVVDPASDAISNVVTEKGRAGRLMEKRFSTDFISTLKSTTESMVKESERMLSKLLKAFDKLESGVSRRNIGLYTTTADTFIKDFAPYHNNFVTYNDKVLGPLREHHAEINKKEQEVRAVEQAKKEQANAKEQARREQIMAEQAEKERLEVEHARRSPLAGGFPRSFDNAGEFKLDMQNKEDAETKARHELIDRFQAGQSTLDKFKNEKGKERMPYMSQIKPTIFDQISPKKEPKPASPPRIRIAPDDMRDTHVDTTAYSKTTPSFAPDSEEGSVDEKIPEFGDEDWLVNKESNLFLDTLNKYAEQNDAIGIVNEILDFSEKIDNTDAIQSAELLAVANSIINDYKSAGIFDFLKSKPAEENSSELQRQPSNRQKPQDLIDRENDLFRSKRIDISDGVVDKSFDSIPALQNINANNIKVTAGAEVQIKKLFVTRLSDILEKDDLSNFKDSINQRLVPVLKHSVHDGWIVSARGAHDTHNPKDKMLEIYTRMNLSLIDAELSGVAKLTVMTRLSSKTNTLTISNISRNFEIEGLAKDFDDDTTPDLKKYDIDDDQEEFDADHEPQDFDYDSYDDVP